MIAKDYELPRARGDFVQYGFVVARSITALNAQQSAVWRLSFPVTGAFDDDLVAGDSQAVQSAVAEGSVVEETQPFVHGPVAGYDEARGAMAVEGELVEVSGLLWSEPVQAEVVEDEQIGRQEAPEGAVQRVVDPGLCHGLE